MPELDPAHPWTGELTTADLARLGAESLRRADPVVIGPYRVLARLGGGGMGRQYLAREADADAEAGGAAYGAGNLVAVKVIRPEHAEDERFRRRFEREVEAVRRVHGRYTAALLGSGFDDEEQLWMATAYVPGLGLDDAVRRFGPLPAPVVWRLAAEIGEAVATIAATGIVHRDLKPSNVLLGADGARVIDFGVAHTADASALTMTGQQVGTPAFMSPEQGNGREAGTPSDVFSLGSVLAHAATGRAPFGEGATLEVIHRVVYSPPSQEVLDALAQTAPALAELVGRCLEKDPAQRPSPQEVIDTARAHAPAQEWPRPLVELIESRSGWSGHAAAVSPMDQLTVLRRGAPEPTVAPGTPRKRRRGLAWGAAACVVAVAAGVFYFVGPGSESSSSSEAARPGSSATATGSSDGDSKNPSPDKPSASGSNSNSGSGSDEKDPPGQNDPSSGNLPDDNPPGDSDGGSEGDPGDDTPAPAPPPQDPPDVTAAPADPGPSDPPARPWDSCRFYSGTALTLYGHKGDRVRQVQCILKARGYDIGPSGVDGDFGVDTQSAVKRFQQNHNLHADGKVGEDTWPALRG